VSDSDPRRRAFRLRPTALLKLGAYFVVCWSMVAVLAAGFPYGELAVLALALYTCVPLFVFLRWGGWPFYPGKAFRLFVLRVFWYTQLALPLIAAAGFVGLVIGLLAGSPIDGARIGAAIVALTLAVIIAIGYLGSQALVVRHVVAELPELPPEFEGFRIVQLTDLHVGPHLPRGRLRRIAREVCAMHPQMVAVTGDIVDDRVEDLEVYRAELGGITAEHGVFLIAGNHDVYAGWPKVEQRLRQGDLGTLLVNEWREIRRGNSAIALVGTGDPAGRGFPSAGVAPDVESAVSGIPAGHTIVALAHNPALFEELAAAGVSLTLSGHTHWGQLALPAAGWSMAGLFIEDAMGIITRGRSLLYISPGTGYWGIPFRIGATGEITLVTLRRSASGTPRASIAGRHRVGRRDRSHSRPVED
jgi:predicted MPP superfamily phosphohydrolase